MLAIKEHAGSTEKPSGKEVFGPKSWHYDSTKKKYLSLRMGFLRPMHLPKTI